MRADSDDAGGRGRGTGGRKVRNQGRGSVPFGQHRWDHQSDRWTWSPGMFTLHGYPDRAIVPTTELLLSHKDPAGRDRAVDIVDRVGREPSTYINYHRIIDATGRTRTVLSLGSSARTADGRLVASGFMADLTETERSASSAAIVAASEGRTVINQAQGAVMAIFGLNADAALAMLIWHSKNQNVKLNALCRALITSFAPRGPITRHEQLTELLLQASNPLRGCSDLDAGSSPSSE